MMLTLQNISSIVCFEINYIASNVWMAGTGDNIWVDLVSNWIKSLAWSDSWQWWRGVWDYHHYHYLNFVKWKTKIVLHYFRLKEFINLKHHSSIVVQLRYKKLHINLDAFMLFNNSILSIFVVQHVLHCVTCLT